MTDIEVEFNIKSVTGSVKLKLSSAVIDLLLYYRKQIPFSYNLFEKLMNSGSKCDSGADWGSFKVQQQKSKAKETLDSIVSLKEDLQKVFKENPEIQEVLVLFGSTLATPIESYLIKLPALTKSSEETAISEENIRKILLQLIQSSDLNAKSNLRTTNMFVLIKNPRMEAETLGDDVTNFRNLGSNFRVPTSCPSTTISLTNTYSHFSIFSDFENLTMHEKNNAETKTENENTGSDCEISWHQSQIIVKGFKDILVNNKSIWN